MENGPSTLHNRASEILGRLRKLDHSLEAITTSVCGTTPQQEGKTPKPIEDYLHEKLNDITAVICSMEDRMVRLGNAVGSSQPNIATPRMDRAGNF